MNTDKSMLEQIDNSATFRRPGAEQQEIPHLLKDRYRKDALGRLGEDLAEQALWRKNFSKVENLNRTRKHNYEFADVLAERDGQTYFIGVKARNEVRAGGVKINDSYNFVLINDAANRRLKSQGKTKAEITRFLLQHVGNLALSHSAIAAWITIPIRPLDGSYAVYFGLVSALGQKRCVPMTAKARATYECLQNWQHDDRITSDLLN